MRFFIAPNYKIKKKFHKHKVHGFDLKPHLLELTTGIAGLKAAENGRITPKQLEATRRVITRKMQRTGKIWFRIFPEIAISKKPQEVRMGKGKGLIKLWIANVRKGRILLEIANTTPAAAKEILASAATKLPIKTIIIFQNSELSL
jgi:large subunit ribosomal protein L16